MVLTLGPAKFYGDSLPRPRFYTDVKFSDEMVDPLSSIMGPLLAWAEEAHWSMGGLNAKRHRLQGRIEGNVEKLRKQQEAIFDQSPKPQKSFKVPTTSRYDKDKNRGGVSETPAPPSAPVAMKSGMPVAEGGERGEAMAAAGMGEKCTDENGQD
ncbi:hypothetical protein ACS0TY_002749 [Phlomoides rotata]